MGRNERIHRLLGHGAKRLANQSSLRLSTPVVKEKMTRLRPLLEDERTCNLHQGDVLIELIDVHRLRAIDIARQTKQRPSDLSQMY